VAEIKAELSRFLRHVQAGETVTVMNRDRPVARLVPVTEEGPLLRIRGPLKDPAGLGRLLRVPPIERRPTERLKILMNDRRKR